MPEKGKIPPQLLPFLKKKGEAPTAKAAPPAKKAAPAKPKTVAKAPVKKIVPKRKGK